MNWEWKKTRALVTGVSELIETLAPVLSLLQIAKLRTVITGVAADTAKVTLNKRFHKREYGQAFTKLSPKERDTVRDIHVVLRRKGYLENFILNVALYGNNINDSAELLRTLAQYSPREAFQLIDDMDLEKEPAHHGKEALKKAQKALRIAKRVWNKVDSELATTLNSTARSLDRARRGWVVNNFGIEEPYYRRLRNVRLTRPTRAQIVTASLLLFLLAAATSAVAGILFLIRTVH